MSVLVARFAGAGDTEKVDRTVYQAFLTATFLSFGVMAPLGYFASPWLLDFVNAAPAVKAEALPFLRIMFVFIGGMLMFFMLSGALRSAGDARTPMVLGIAMTVLNLVLNVILIRVRPIPASELRGRPWVRHRVGTGRVLFPLEAHEPRLGLLVFRMATGWTRLAHHPIVFSGLACPPAFRGLP